MKRKLAVGLLTVCLLLSLGGCTEKTAEDMGTESDFKIGWSVPTMDNFVTEITTKGREYAEENGAEVVLLNADGKTDQQLQDISNLVVQQCDVILVNALDSTGAVPAVNEAMAAGIPVIDVGTNIDTECTVHLVTANYAWGQAMGDYAARYLDENPNAKLNIGYIWGLKGVTNTQLRYDGFVDRMQEYLDNGRAEILIEKDCEWSTDKAMATVEDWMTAYPEMNCILCQSDAMALGVTQVLNSAGINLEEYMVCSIDGSKEGMGEVLEGRLDCTIANDRTEYAKLIMDVAMNVLEDEDAYAPDEKIEAGAVVECTEENVEELYNSWYAD